jgi:glycine oxidase
MTSSYDIAIVGQGLAGTLMAFELQQAGKKIIVIDQKHQGAATKVAAGLINPITGRRIVKSENIDTLLPIAKATYKALEQDLDISIWQDLNILWSLSSVKEENDWYNRAHQAGLSDYILAQADTQDILPFVKNSPHFGEVTHAAQVNIRLLIETFAQKLKNEGRLLEETFDFNALTIRPENCIYKDIAINKIIFCEGHQARFNPLFPELPLQVAKGEALLINAPDLPSQRVYKHNISICPLPNNSFWVGSNYEWNPTDNTPTNHIRDTFETQLNDFLNVPYSVLEHNAAIRPSTKDRKLIMLQHNEFSNIFLFNGLGTKGTSLAPYWVKHFIAANAISA